MVSKVFFDANILLDFTLKRDDYTDAKELFSLAINGTINVFISPSILHIVAYWLTKAYGNEKARTILLEMLATVTVIDAPHEIAIMALHSKIKDIEDALQYYTALHHKMGAFISRDAVLKKSAISLLPVYSMKDFIKLTSEK